MAGAVELPQLASAQEPVFISHTFPEDKGAVKWPVEPPKTSNLSNKTPAA